MGDEATDRWFSVMETKVVEGVLGRFVSVGDGRTSVVGEDVCIAQCFATVVDAQ